MKNSRSHIVLKAILSKSPERDLTRFLSESERKALDELPDFTEEFKAEGAHLLTKVHWSWFLPTLKSYSESEQKLFLASLDPYAAKNLARTLILSSNGTEPTQIARNYLRKVLLDSLKGPHDRLLPLEYLPPTPLNRLLSLSKKELTRIIDLLSIHDLALELRQIVETKILKRIYSLLSEEEKNLLKQLMTHKDAFSLGKIGLDRWDGSEETLRTILHKRGILRLGAGLSGQDPDLVWYICHQLDIGRGAALHKACAREKHIVTDAIIKQIEQLL